MSVRHSKRVLDSDLKSIPKLVLLVFADTANETGVCWPGVEYVAKRASVSTRTVQRLIPIFIEQGLLARQPRYGKSGRQLSSAYQIFPSHMPSCDDSTQESSGGDKTEIQGVTPWVVEGDTSVTQTTTEPINNLNNHQLTLPITLTRLEQSSALKLISKLPYEDAQTLLDELSGRISKGQVRNPISYLRMLVKLKGQGSFMPELSNAVAAQRQKQKIVMEANSPTVTRKVSSEEFAKYMKEMRKALDKG